MPTLISLPRALPPWTPQINSRNLRPRITLSASASPAPAGVDLNPLVSALSKKDSGAVKEALDELCEIGWARKWSSQPYVSRRTTPVRELAMLGIKNAENLGNPSVRNDELRVFWLFLPVSFLGEVCVLHDCHHISMKIPLAPSLKYISEFDFTKFNKMC